MEHKTFQEIYGATITEVYEKEIKRFMDEEFFFHMNKQEMWENPKTHAMIDKGHIWICHHPLIGGFEIHNLTVEPADGGQYEIAVRFPHVEGSTTNDHKYSGYVAMNKGDGAILCGFDTGGH
jgi:hypothetical protein